MPTSQFCYATVEGTVDNLQKLIKWPYTSILGLNETDIFLEQPEGKPNSDLKKGPLTTLGFATTFYIQPKYERDHLFQASILSIPDRKHSTAQIAAAIKKSGVAIVKETSVGEGPTTRLFTIEGTTTNIMKLLDSNKAFESRLFYFGIGNPSKKIITEIETAVSELELEN